MLLLNVACLQAYKAGLYGPKIVWVFLGYYAAQFWTDGLEETGCTAEEMALAVEGIFLITYADANPVEKKGLANLTCWYTLLKLFESSVHAYV